MMGESPFIFLLIFLLHQSTGVLVSPVTYNKSALRHAGIPSLLFPAACYTSHVCRHNGKEII